jgi:hypothetical protein
MRRRSRTTVILVVVAAVTALMASTALSDNVERVASTVTLARTNPFHGHVTARKHPCEVNRLVRLVKIRSPQNHRVVGSTHTNDHGRWSIPAPAGGVRPGDYFAKVKRRKKELAGGTTTYSRPGGGRRQMWYIPAPVSSVSRRAMSAIVVERKTSRSASTPSAQMPPASLPS